MHIRVLTYLESRYLPSEKFSFARYNTESGCLTRLRGIDPVPGTGVVSITADTTVVMELVKSAGNVFVDDHDAVSGSGVSQRVLIEDGDDALDCEYKTHFRRGDLPGPPTTSDSYKVRVYFKDVDNNTVLQGESGAVTF